MSYSVNYDCIAFTLNMFVFSGSINDVDFHPNEPIILSGSSDKNLYLGELDA